MKKLLLYSLLILSIVILAGCIIPTGCGTRACNIPGDEKTKSHCFQQLAVSKNDPALCDKATSGGTMTKCLILIAEKNYNPEVCKNIPLDSKPPQYTREMCYQTVAAASGDKELCKELDGYESFGNDLADRYSRLDCEIAASKRLSPNPLTAKNCGGTNEPCCPEGKCETGATCRTGKCVRCGYRAGDPCCFDEDEMCYGDLECQTSGICTQCGYRGQSPCYNTNTKSRSCVEGEVDYENDLCV